MIDYPIKQIVNLTHPGQPAGEGDEVEIETTGGWIREVDPRTRACTEARQRFRMVAGGGLTPVRIKPFKLAPGWRK